MRLAISIKLKANFYNQLESNTMPSKRTNLESEEETIMLRPIRHILQAGKETRNIVKRLVCAFNFWIKCPEDKIPIVEDIGESLFNVSLIFDDVEDNSIMRRGLPAAHLVYGVSATIYATILQMMILMQRSIKFSKNKEAMTNDCIKLGSKMFRGQGLEIYHRENFICPTDEEYRQIVDGKVTSAIVFGERLLQVHSDNTKHFTDSFMEKINYFIVIYNDYINLHSPKYTNARVYCDDLDEGKFSYPIVHGVHAFPNDHRLLDLLKARPLSLEQKKEFVSILESFGSFEHSRNQLDNLRNGVLKDIKEMKLERNPILEKVFDDVINNLETEIYCDGCDVSDAS